jgi:hypothetical protein
MVEVSRVCYELEELLEGQGEDFLPAFGVGSEAGVGSFGWIVGSPQLVAVL